MLNSGNEFLNEMDTNAVMKVFDDRSILNLYSQFCTLELCSQVKDGALMYEDGSHLSSVGSMFVAPALEQALSLLIQR
jgi:lysophospholipase L1-like esterase